MIFWFENSCNNMQETTTHVFLLSAIGSRHNGLAVHNQNIKDSITLFCARTIPKHSWLNDQDRFRKPHKG